MFANKNHAGSRCARCHTILNEEDIAEYREDAWYHQACWAEGVMQLHAAMKRVEEIAQRGGFPEPDRS